MSIENVLQHRATVRRATEVVADGRPIRTWLTVAELLPCLFDRGEVSQDPTWTASQQREADSTGVLFTRPSANVRPGDRLIITRPNGLGSFEVMPAQGAHINCQCVLIAEMRGNDD